MKILQIITKRQYRGAEVFAANLSEELISLGHEIIFAGLYANNKNALVVEKALNIDLSRRKKRLLSPELVLELVLLIKKEKPDVVQCNGSDTLKYMVAASYFVKDIPLIYRNISTISEWLDSTLKKAIYKYLFQRVDYVTSVGQESIQDLIKTMNFPEERTKVIRRGIPLKKVDKEKARKVLLSSLGLRPETKLAIHIGNFSPEKNHTFLLEIFSELALTHPDFKLICVGDGIMYEDIKTRIKELELEETVFLLGFRKDIPELLAGTDCFVLSSKVEGVPGVILEAAAQKVPSISTNVGGVKEVLVNRSTGYLIDHFDKEDFKDRLKKVLTDEAHARLLGENAFSLVLKEFNPEKNARKFEELYSKLATNR